MLSAVKLLVASALLAGAFADDYCKSQFRKNGFVPQLTDGLNSTDLLIVFRDGKPINCGDPVDAMTASKSPTFKFDLTKKCKYATIVCVDPNTVIGVPFLDYMCVNVPPEALKKGYKKGGDALDILDDDSGGDIKASYSTQTHATSGSGLSPSYRVCLVYCQCQKQADIRQFGRTKRIAFDLKKYAASHDLNCAAAGNFYVPTQLGFTLPSVVTMPPVVVPLPYGVVRNDTPRAAVPV